MRSGTMIAGKNKIGKNTVFNLKSAATNKIEICDNVVVGAFSNVHKSITKPGLYLGSPARLAKAI